MKVHSAQLQSEADAFWYDKGILAEEREHAWKLLRQRLQATTSLIPGFEDRATLLRFLKARQWNISKAESMYKVRPMLQGKTVSACKLLPTTWLASNYTASHTPLSPVSCGVIVVGCSCCLLVVLVLLKRCGKIIESP